MQHITWEDYCVLQPLPGDINAHIANAHRAKEFRYWLEQNAFNLVGMNIVVHCKDGPIELILGPFDGFPEVYRWVCSEEDQSHALARAS